MPSGMVGHDPLARLGKVMASWDMPFSRPSGAARVLAPFAAGAALLLGACAPVTYVQEPPPIYVQGPPPVPTYYPEAPAPQPAANPLDQLMAPIALYPDPLISLILPAAAFPPDVAAAGAYLKGGGDPGQVDTQPWDQSVRSLAHYPEVVTWMAQNGPWTQTVGAAFVSQPAEVMKSIQRLRELARAAGTLTDTPEQQVVVEDSYVEIEPAQPEAIYVPRYDPEVVFVDQPYYGYNGPYFTYGPAYGAGNWLTFGCNWSGGGVVIVDANYWHGDGGWWHPRGPGPGGEFVASVNARPWSFPANRARPQAPGGWQTHAQIINPRPIAGAPARPPQSAFRDIHTRGPAAVSAVARNPAAFKGKPINTAIIARPSGTLSQARAPQGQPSAVRPAVEARPQPVALARPAPFPAPEPRVAAARTPETPAPAVHAEEEGKTGHEIVPANGKPPEKKNPKKEAKPEPAEEKPKEGETPH
jgi:hypothetical protein